MRFQEWRAFDGLGILGTETLFESWKLFLRVLIGVLVAIPIVGLAQTDPIPATLVQTTEASAFSPPSSDPAGLVYVRARNRLLLADSEINEVDSLFAGANLFEVDLSGVLVATAATFVFSDEPTGVTINPENGHFFFSDDDAREIIRVDPGSDQALGTADDICSSFDTLSFGSGDPEGVAYDTLGGNLFIVDGVEATVFRVAPGANGFFDGVPAAGGDDEVSSFDVGALGVVDPEGIEFSVATSTLFIVESVTNGFVYETTTSGTLLSRIELAAGAPEVPAGLTFAPGSLDSGSLHLYVVDRDRDEVNDGKLHEFSLPASPLPSITTIDPAQGPELISVTLRGKNFIGTSAVEVGVVAALFTVVDDTELQVTIPDGTMSDRIRVANGAGVSFSPARFVVTGSPVITTFFPKSAGEGEWVRIVGLGLSDVDCVTFDGVATMMFSIDSETQVRAMVPPGVNRGRIGVTNPLGSALSDSDLDVLPTRVFLPTDDAHVRSNQANTNFGDVDRLVVKAGRSVFHTYLKFAVTDTEPVHRVRLRLFVNRPSCDGGSVFHVSNDFSDGSAPWDEDTLTWNNMPGLSGEPVAQTGSVFLDRWVEIDVSSVVTGDGTVSFGFSSLDLPGVLYSSKEGGQPPQLILTVSSGVDRDGDTVEDGVDNCPDEANGDQSNTDSDEFGDACDNCPDAPNSQSDVDNDLIGDECDNCPSVPNDGTDSDNDLIGDACDNCPNMPDEGQEDGDGDTIGDVCDVCANDALNDVDGDGVCGDLDNCPDVANKNQVDTDDDGAGDACDFPEGAFIRGDVNQDGSINIADALFVLNALFSVEGPPPPCWKSADSNDDGELDISDGVALLKFLFQSGGVISPPSAICGLDLTEDDLGCDSFSCD